MPFRDPEHRGEAQPASLEFSGKERVEDSGPRGGIHTAAVVDHAIVNAELHKAQRNLNETSATTR